MTMIREYFLEAMAELRHAKAERDRYKHERDELAEALRKARTMAAAGAPRCAGNPHLMNPSDAEAIARFDVLLSTIKD